VRRVKLAPGRRLVYQRAKEPAKKDFVNKPAFTRRQSMIKLLLLLPFLGLLWVPFYNQESPSLLGFPFFYWYQLMWVPLTSLLIWIVYRNGLRKGEE
jgi:hypothetical protein